MKILLYDVADFEQPILDQLEKTFQGEITCIKKQLTIKSLEKAKGYGGISILGYSKVNQDILMKMKEYGILYLSTRTIGFDHIDIAYAKKLGIHRRGKWYHTCSCWNKNSRKAFFVISKTISKCLIYTTLCFFYTRSSGIYGNVWIRIHSIWSFRQRKSI